MASSQAPSVLARAGARTSPGGRNTSPSADQNNRLNTANLTQARKYATIYNIIPSIKIRLNTADFMP